MNLIKILVKLLDKAYHAEARKHHKVADKHIQASERHLDAEEHLRMQADAAGRAAVADAVAANRARKQAEKVQAKAAEVSQFFTV